jgi:hypothetical protein
MAIAVARSASLRSRGMTFIVPEYPVGSGLR